MVETAKEQFPLIVSPSLTCLRCAIEQKPAYLYTFRSCASIKTMTDIVIAEIDAIVPSFEWHFPPTSLVILVFTQTTSDRLDPQFQDAVIMLFRLN